LCDFFREQEDPSERNRFPELWNDENSRSFRVFLPHVDPGAEPARRRRVAEAVEMPFFRIETREGGDLLASIMEVAVVEVAFWGAVPWLEAALF